MSILKRSKRFLALFLALVMCFSQVGADFGMLTAYADEDLSYTAADTAETAPAEELDGDAAAEDTAEPLAETGEEPDFAADEETAEPAELTGDVETAEENAESADEGSESTEAVAGSDDVTNETAEAGETDSLAEASFVLTAAQVYENVKPFENDDLTLTLDGVLPVGAAITAEQSSYYLFEECDTPLYVLTLKVADSDGNSFMPAKGQPVRVTLRSAKIAWALALGVEIVVRTGEYALETDLQPTAFDDGLSFDVNEFGLAVIYLHDAAEETEPTGETEPAEETEPVEESEPVEKSEPVEESEPVLVLDEDRLMRMGASEKGIKTFDETAWGILTVQVTGTCRATPSLERAPVTGTDTLTPLEGWTVSNLNHNDTDLNMTVTVTSLEDTVLGEGESLAIYTVTESGGLGEQILADAELESSVTLGLSPDAIGLALVRVAAPELVIEQQEIPVAVDGVSASFSGPLPENATITMEPVFTAAPARRLMASSPMSVRPTAGSAAQTDSSSARPSDSETLLAYDITIYDAQGKTWEPEEPITVTLSADAIAAAAAEGKTIVVVHYCEDGTVEEITPAVTGDTVSFEANSFSTYEIRGFLDLVSNWFWEKLLNLTERVFEIASETVTLTLTGTMPRSATARAVETTDNNVLFEELGETVLYSADITLYNYDAEIQPNWGALDVSLSSEEIAAAIAAGYTLNVYHMDNDGYVTGLDPAALNVTEDRVSFPAASFSQYIVTGTAEQTELEIATEDGAVTLSGPLPVNASVTAVEASEDEATAENEELVLAYDITLYNYSTPIQPQQPPLTVTIRNEAIGGAIAEGRELSVYHVNEDGSMTEVEILSAAEDTITFEAQSFSTYVVTEVILEKTIELDGQTYKVTVAYDSTMGLPTDAQLSVSEMSVDDPAYLEYLASTAETLGVSAGELGYLRLLDIAIVDANGTKYQPNDQVTVTVELIDDVETGDLRVVHFGEETEELEATTEGDTVSFETSGFSLFSFADLTLVQNVVDAVFGSTYTDKAFENDDIIVSGRMPRTAIVEVNPATVEIEGAEVLVAYDIKIYAGLITRALGLAWQPTDGALTVQVKSDALENGKYLSVYHMADENAEPEYVASVEVSDSSVSFEAESFSIYPITDGPGENARIGYRFWYYNGVTDSYEQITTQYFRYTDVQTQGMTIHEPSIPGISQSEMVIIFEGWFKGAVDGANAELQGDAVTVADLNAELQAKSSDDYVEGTIVDIIAKLKAAYYITYVDVNPNSIIATDLVVKAEQGDTSFFVKTGVKPTKYEENLKGWRLLEEIADENAQLYQEGYAYTITENITLAPVIEGGYWLVFNDNDMVDDGTGNMVSGGASYTAPSFYMNNANEQQPTVQPPDPEWAGYEFAGWYEDEGCTIPYEFGGVLTRNTTVHAKWIPAESSYSVIIWKQPTDPNATDYDFDQSFTISEDVKTGDLVYLDSGYTRIYGEDGTSSDLDKQYFTYNQEKTDQYIIVKANGSSVLNVYYDRVPMTITFYTWGRGYTYTETTAETGTQYGIVGNEYVPLTRIDGEEDVYSYAYSPRYIEAPENLGATYDQYGIVDGEYKQLDRVSDYSYSYNPFNPTTGTNGVQYALVDGEYVQLTRVAISEYYALTNSLTAGNDYLIVSRNNAGTGYALGHNGERVATDQVTVRNGTAATNNTRYIDGSDVDSTSVWTAGNGYTFKNGNYYISQEASWQGRELRISTEDSNWNWNGNNNRLSFRGIFDSYYLRYNNGTYSLSTSNNSVYLFQKVAQYAWQYTRDGVTVTLSDSETRYVQSGNSQNYTGSRYTRSGANWWEYSYEATVAQTTGLYGVDDRGGHVAVTRSNNPNHVFYTYNGVEFTGTRYYHQNYNPVSYSGTIYTLDNGVYHVTTEGAVSGRYGMDENGVFRSLIGTVSHPQLWTYVDSNGDTQHYTGTRYTRSTNEQNSWQLYKQFVGVYGATFEQYGYEWPMEYNWYEFGGKITDGGNADRYVNSNGRTVNLSSGDTGGSRMTLKTTFEPLDGELDVKFYGDTASSSGSTITFYTQNLDGTYELADTIYLGGNSGSFHINDKYTGFHAVSYSTNGGASWTNVTPKGADGYYGSAVSYSSSGLRIRFDRTDYDLVFFPDPGSGGETITYALPYGTSMSSYANQSPGQKLGHYFLGWYADDAFTTPFDFSQTMPDHPVSVFGYWRMERVRAVFVPGANNVYIDPSQALSFRVNYDERIDGSFLEAATRVGYTLDGWYTDPEFTNKFLFSTPVNASTDGVDMTYQTSTRWTATRVNYGDNTETNANVRGILILYAKWVVNTSEKGVDLVYDAGSAAQYDGLGNLTTTVPIDPRLYQDGTNVVVGAAPSGYSDLYYFDYWEIVDGSGNVLTVDGVSAFAPGTTFNVNNISLDDAYAVSLDEDGEVLLKTIKLRAHYTRREDVAERYTTITYDGNTMTEPVYPSGTEVLCGKTRDGSDRYSLTLDTEINANIRLKNEEDFYLDGYTLVGWSFFQGTYDEQISAANAWNSEHPEQTVVVMFEKGQLVAADDLSQNPVNDESNILYAMWQPKTYTVTVKQVVEDDVPVQSFTYRYKSGVENALASASASSLTLNGDASTTYTNLTTDAAVPLQYYGRLGHAFNITPPTIADTADYAVRVSATVLHDDGTRETLDPNTLGNYEIRGNVEITFTYSLKVAVTLEKRALNNSALLTGSKFVLTPVQWNAETQRWEQVGTTTFEYDMSSVSSLMKRLQEGVYRVEETQAPTDYAMMGAPLLLTVRRNTAFLIRTTTSGAVSGNVAKITGSDSHTLTIYDRPIREITIRKIVDGQNLETAGYTFSVRLTLEGSAMRGYDAVGDGLAADTTNSAGIIEFKLGDSDEKTLRIPWDAVIEITENEYAQCSVQTESAAGIADLDTENDRIYRCTVDSNDTITYTNKNVLLTVTKQVTGGFGDTTLPFAFTLSGLTAGKIYHLTVAGRSVTRTASSDGTVAFELRHGEQMSIPLIEGSTVTVSETEVQDYTTSLAVNGGESEEASAKTVTLNEATTVDFTNYRPPVAPTGVDFDSIPYVWILALGGLLAVAALPMRRRRRGGDA